MFRYDVFLRVIARLNNLLYEERGQTLGEYGLLVSVVGVSVVIIGVIAFRTQIVNSFGAMSACLNGSC